MSFSFKGLYSTPTVPCRTRTPTLTGFKVPQVVSPLNTG
jgi:hypothetical protein